MTEPRFYTLSASSGSGVKRDHLGTNKSTAICGIDSWRYITHESAAERRTFAEIVAAEYDRRMYPLCANCASLAVAKHGAAPPNADSPSGLSSPDIASRGCGEER